MNMQTMMTSFAVAVLAIGSYAETRRDVNQTCLLVAPAAGFLLKPVSAKEMAQAERERAAALAWAKAQEQKKAA